MLVRTIIYILFVHFLFFANQLNNLYSTNLINILSFIYNIYSFRDNCIEYFMVSRDTKVKGPTGMVSKGMLKYNFFAVNVYVLKFVLCMEVLGSNSLIHLRLIF